MIYKYNETVSAKALSDLRESVGWNRMENEYTNPLMKSYYHIAVYVKDELVGYIDCVSNGVTDAYIQDLMVHPDYQGKGVGTDLMNKMIMYLKEKRIYMISVVFEESLKPFYDKFGFYNMLCGQMETFSSNAFLLSGKDVMGVFDEVKERVTARAVMERAGIVFNRSNMCKCPFHQDKTASMKVKPNDKKYFCFGCGEKGDAIDFVAKYYNLSPKDAAMQIADEFGITYDSSVRSPPKPVRREKSPMQILSETKTKTYRVLSDYLHLLKDWKRDFEPKSMDEIDARYEEAVNNLPKVEYQLDIMLWGTEEEKEMLLKDLGKEVAEIERKVNEHRRNQGTIDHNRQRSCEAVH